MKGTFAALLLAVLLAGCKQAGPPSTTDPFFGSTRIPPPPTGSAQPIPPGSAYYQNPPGAALGGSPASPTSGSTLPPPPANTAPAGSHIPLPGSPGYSPGYSAPAGSGQIMPGQVYPAPGSTPAPINSSPGSSPYHNSPASDPFPNADGSLSPVRRGVGLDPARASSADSSIAQTTALGAQGSRVMVPEKALNWQETQRGEQSTFGAEVQPAPRVGGSLPPSGSPLGTRPPTAAEASSRPLSDRERIIRTVGPDGRMVPNGARAQPNMSTAAGISQPGVSGRSSAAPANLPPNVQVINIMDLPPAKKRNDPDVRPTSATEPLAAESGGASDPRSNIYIRGVQPTDGTSGGPNTRYSTTARRPDNLKSGVFCGRLDYSEAHRKWCVDLVPEPGEGDANGPRRILLADDVLLSGLERGDYVKLEGRAEDVGDTADGLPIVKVLEVLDFREDR